MGCPLLNRRESGSVFRDNTIYSTFGVLGYRSNAGRSGLGPRIHPRCGPPRCILACIAFTVAARGIRQGLLSPADAGQASLAFSGVGTAQRCRHRIGSHCHWLRCAPEKQTFGVFDGWPPKRLVRKCALSALPVRREPRGKVGRRTGWLIDALVSIADPWSGIAPRWLRNYGFPVSVMLLKVRRSAAVMACRTLTAARASPIQ